MHRLSSNALELAPKCVAGNGLEVWVPLLLVADLLDLFKLRLSHLLLEQADCSFVPERELSKRRQFSVLLRLIRSLPELACLRQWQYKCNTVLRTTASNSALGLLVLVIATNG